MTGKLLKMTLILLNLNKQKPKIPHENELIWTQKGLSNPREPHLDPPLLPGEIIVILT